MKLARLLAFLLVLSAGAVPAQVATPPSGVPTSPPAFGGVGAADNGPFARNAQERLEKGRQSERQKRLVADTDRLLTLATQLKEDMDKTTKDTLSIEVIRKAEEIEKLAKSVKDRMKG